ncbi:MAG: c-type cytochrome biogenesis protein CcsB [Betaproteobacteria bacterium]|nr:c-type cytochrome biogenesis protein CcsB [Betaproteobacteria bacterium]
MELTRQAPLAAAPWWRAHRANWLFAAVLAGGALFALNRYGGYMDIYEKVILLATVPTLAATGWHWRRFQTLLAVVAPLALAGLALYQGDLARAEQVFGLKYLLSSQSAIGWMGALFFMATGAYWLGLLARAEFAARVGTVLTWAAVAMGTVGLLVRWYESYLIAPDYGHIPVSNLYEVFVLFCVLTALLYLYYEQRYATRQLGAFVCVAISAAVGFLMWYSLARGAQEIQPLIPALQSYWMKIHVPANFIGYGAFAVAAMVGVAWLLASRGVLASRLPSPQVMDDVMYRAIAIGFAFFTVATILGALWAAEAWGTYWQWDPKETWALIVWLNYAAWLHMRLTKGLRGAVLAWWAVVGLVVVTFAFLGVNMFLSGLHSYGTL